MAEPPSPLPPGSTIGILGGGQLGRMLSVAASRLGLKTHIYNDEPNAPAFDVAAGQSIGAYEDGQKIADFSASVDVVTCEFENVPAAALDIAGRSASVFPPPKSFEVAQDRAQGNKTFVSGLGNHGRPLRSRGQSWALEQSIGPHQNPRALEDAPLRL